MPNRLSDAVFRSLLERLPQNRAISRADLRTHDLPDAVGHFLEHALDRRLELETARIKDVASGWVDPDRAEVAMAREAYLKLLARYAHYPAAEWPRALRQAVQLVVAYLLMPVPTLIHFVFGEERTELHHQDVERRVAYFVGYSHLRTAVTAFIERRPDQDVTRRELAEALEIVDRRICRDYGGADWQALVAPLLDLAGRTDMGAVELRILTQFFDSRDGQVIAAGIRGYARARNLEALTPQQVEAAITLVAGNGRTAIAETEAAVAETEAPASEAETAVAKAEAPVIEPAGAVKWTSEPVVEPQQKPESPAESAPEPMQEPEPAADPQPFAALPTAPAEPIIIETEYDQDVRAILDPGTDDDHPPVIVEAAPVAADPEPGSEPDLDGKSESDNVQGSPSEGVEPVPLWLRFRAEVAEDNVSAPPPSPQPEEAEPLWKKFQDSVEPEAPEITPRVVRLHPPSEPEPILDSASVEFAVLGPAAWQRDVFIERLFAGSPDAYFQALGQLMAAPDWRSASDVIAVDVFRANRVNIYDEAAIDFTNAVESQFKKR